MDAHPGTLIATGKPALTEKMSIVMELPGKSHKNKISIRIGDIKDSIKRFLNRGIRAIRIRQNPCSELS